jgi:hypothetical protein
MTKAEAYRVLGTSSSASRSKAELLYQDKCRKLRLQMVPGMPVAARQSARAEMAKINTAWQAIQAPGPARATTRQATATPRTTRSSPATVLPYRKPRTLGEAWQQVVSMMPFSEPVTVIILILVFLVTMAALLSRL